MKSDPPPDLDYRFTLANERTFLAWIRTSLGLLAGGVAVHTLVAHFRLPGVRSAIATVAIALAVILAIGAYLQWRKVERAMRAGERLPGNILIPVLALGVTLVSALAVIGVLSL
ncbi:YidH family protein [Nocardia sp. NBC_00511]|uniref:YidH family protein n=1 Tax=Nocardia sp. NBC_00511 TaxID=2903591 RepID=UPI0030DEC1EF